MYDGTRLDVRFVEQLSADYIWKFLDQLIRLFVA